MQQGELALAYRAFHVALGASWPGWSLAPVGLLGPGGERLQLLRRHSLETPGHFDVCLAFDRERGAPVELWDCVKGYGKDDEVMARTAAHAFATTTAVAVRELRAAGRGRFADHHHGLAMRGVRGWHCIVSPALGFGAGGDGCALRAWWCMYPWLRRIGAQLIDGIAAGACPVGVKVLFGSDEVAEVRVNGERHEPASAALLALPWPRGGGLFLRCYVLLLHPESCWQSLRHAFASWSRRRNASDPHGVR